MRGKRGGHGKGNGGTRGHTREWESKRDVCSSRANDRFLDLRSGAKESLITSTRRASLGRLLEWKVETNS